MVTDLIIGTLGMIGGLILGFGWNSGLVFFAVFILDGDIVINELFRIFIKKEKKLSVNNFLDEYSYTHKFVFHFPLIIIPIVFIIGLLYINFLFGVLLSIMVLFHLIHDTVDHNFDGVSWLYPFNSYVYKLRNGSLEIKTRTKLREEAKKLAKTPRSSRGILKDNTLY